MALQEKPEMVTPTQNFQNDTETVQEMIFKKSRSTANRLREKGVYYIRKKRTTKGMPSIKELSPAEQELRRQMWRLSSQKYRERKMKRMKQQSQQQEFITELHSMVDNDTTTGEQDFLNRIYDTSKTEPIEIQDEGPADMESDTQCDASLSCPTTSLVRNDFDFNSSLKQNNIKKRRSTRHSEPAVTVLDRSSRSSGVHFGNFVPKEPRNNTSLSNTETIEIQDEDGSEEVESDTQYDVNIAYPATSLIRNDFDLNSALKLNGKKRNSEPAETLLDRYLNITQKSSDEHQVFGDFVAQELRNISSEHLRKQLRRLIQRDILLVAEIEDRENSDNHGESNSLNSFIH